MPFAFTPADGYRNITTFPTTPASEAAFRDSMMSLLDQLRDYMNNSVSIVSVKTYGAVGNGTTDDTAAIQSAIEAAKLIKGIVSLPPGTYKTTAPLTVSGNGFIRLVGSGGHNQSSVIQGNFVGNILNITASYLVQVEQIRLVHQGTSASNGSVISLSGEQHRVVNCSIENTNGNTSDMILFTGSNTVLQNNTFNNNTAGAYSIRCKTATVININSKIDDNYFAGVGMGVIVTADDATKRPEGLEITENTMLLTGAEQISLRSGLHIDISHNILDQASTYAVQIYSTFAGVESVFIEDNYISTASAPTVGIAIYCPAAAGVDTKYININNNEITLCGYGVVLESRANNCILKGNQLNVIDQTAIKVDQAKNVVIAGGNIVDLTTQFSLDLKDVAAGGPFLIHDNILNGNRVLTVTDKSKFLVKDNSGWKTEGYFTQNVAVDVATTVNFSIPHTLSDTPLIGKIVLGVYSTTGQTDFKVSKLIISSVTTTNINCSITIDTAAPAGRQATVTAFGSVY